MIKARSEEILVYHKVIMNLHDCEKTLKKATKVLKKYYDWLHAAQAPHHYEKKEGKDSGGSNTNRWLKSKIDDEEKWYDADSSLYVKVYDKENPVGLLSKQKREEPEPPDTWGEDEEIGEGAKGGDVVGMLEYIYDETKKEENGVHMDEEADQHAFEKAQRVA